MKEPLYAALCFEFAQVQKTFNLFGFNSPLLQALQARPGIFQADSLVALRCRYWRMPSFDAYPECKTSDFIEVFKIGYKPLENPQLLRDNLYLLTPLFGEKRRMGGAQRVTHQTVHQPPMRCAVLPSVL